MAAAVPVGPAAAQAPGDGPVDSPPVLTLDRTIALALEHAPAAVAAEASATAARADLLQSRGTLLPSFGLTSIYNNSSNQRFAQATGQLVSESYSAQVTGSYEIFSGGRRFAQLRAAGAGMLWVTGTSMSAPVLLGVILLAGIVVNNAILLVEYREQGRHLRGLTREAAVVEAGAIRLRPIIMTTITTACGMLPLALGIGQGSELMQPLALAVVGGLTVSTLLTLFVVPSAYIILNTGADALGTWLTGKVPQPVGPGIGDRDVAPEPAHVVAREAVHSS